MVGRRIQWIAAAVVALAAIYTVAWHGLAFRLEGIMDEAAAPSAEKDWHASWTRLEADGFPLSMRMTAQQPKVVWGRGGEQVTWQASELVMITNPFNPTVVTLVLPHRQDLAVETSSRRQVVGISMVHGRAAIGLASGEVDSIDIGLEDVTVISGRGTALAAADMLDLASATRADGEGRDVFLEVTDLTTGSGSAGQVERGLARIRVVGAVPRQGTARERLDAWRRAGGYVDLEDLVVEWSPVVAWGQGRLALDRENRPIGALRLDIVGYRQIITALVQAGKVRQDQADFLAAALDLMARPTIDGQRRLEIDLSMQHGRLTIGPFTVMRLAPLWPPP
ncbi:MAG: DUF2125 domain-containing protein [bacterium]|nr:DUF2125 domain-containing protein [bacterium]MDE0239233.1 DUF2125 domain-containing protein [bacterium]